jgi:PRTRC genetic system protein C
MAATTKQLIREFNYNGVRIPDPNPSLSPEKAVEALAAGAFPELVNAKIEPGEQDGNVVTYKITVAAKVKG